MSEQHNRAAAHITAAARTGVGRQLLRSGCWDWADDCCWIWVAIVRWVHRLPWCPVQTMLQAQAAAQQQIYGQVAGTAALIEADCLCEADYQQWLPCCASRDCIPLSSLQCVSHTVSVVCACAACRAQRKDHLSRPAKLQTRQGMPPQHTSAFMSQVASAFCIAGCT